MATSTVVVPDRQVIGHNPQEILNKLSDVAAAVKADTEGITAASLASTAAADASYGTAGAAGVGVTSARADHTHKVKQDTVSNITLSSNAATIAVAAGRWRRVAAAALSGAGTITLSTTGAVAGDVIEVTRLDTTANTLAIVDGGSGTPTLCTLVASKIGFAKAAYDGSNWQLVACSAT